MPSGMIERVANAIRAYEAEVMLDTGCVNSSGKQYREGKARAAIEAMREPTEAMKCAGNEIREPCDLCSGSICVADQVWLAMIDAALTPSIQA